jgi:hypothetical protein
MIMAQGVFCFGWLPTRRSGHSVESLFAPISVVRLCHKDGQEVKDTTVCDEETECHHQSSEEATYCSSHAEAERSACTTTARTSLQGLSEVSPKRWSRDTGLKVISDKADSCGMGALGKVLQFCVSSSIAVAVLRERCGFRRWRHMGEGAACATAAVHG